MVQVTEEDYRPNLPQALRLIGEMNESVKNVSDVVGSMLQRVKMGEMSTESGLSFLEVKYQMLLDYLINLTYVVLRKCSGQKIVKDPAIERLIEIRTVLEKIRPIDHKLRYQIDKLVKTAVTGTTNSADPLNFKAKPSNLLNKDESEDESSDDDEATPVQKEKSYVNESEEVGKKYVPPKLTSMPYEDETAAEKKEKLKDRERRAAVNSTIINEWKEEFLDVPVEISGGSRAQQIISKAMKERERYEEDNFTRLPITKAEKHRQKRLSTMGMLGDELTNFGRIGDGKSKKRKSNTKAKKGLKKRKFR